MIETLIKENAKKIPQDAKRLYTLPKKCGLYSKLNDLIPNQNTKKKKLKQNNIFFISHVLFATLHGNYKDI